MQATTRAALEALLKADPNISPEHRRAILDACDRRPAGEPPERLLTIREAAARAGKSTRTLFRWIEDGRLEPVKITARLFQIREADLHRLIDQIGGPPAAPVASKPPERIAAALTRRANKPKGRP